MISLRKMKHYENNNVYKKFLKDIDKPSYMMPNDVSKEVSREVQEMRKSYKMKAHVWRKVFLAPRKTRKKIGTDVRMEAQLLKEALPEGGSIIIFCHAECTQS
jgi:hypothetical protein